MTDFAGSGDRVTGGKFVATSYTPFRWSWRSRCAASCTSLDWTDFEQLASNTSRSDSGLLSGTRYYYRVFLKNDFIQSAPSYVEIVDTLWYVSACSGGAGAKASAVFRLGRGRGQ